MCLTKTNPVRAACIGIIEYPQSSSNKYFDGFITFFIVLNTIVLCLPNTSVCTSYYACDYAGEPTLSDLAGFNEVGRAAVAAHVRVLSDARCDTRPALSRADAQAMEWVFNIVFLIECVVKIIALGFIMGPNAYLKESWNILDFIVVVSSLILIAEIPGVPNLRMLRTFRMLRPLKSVNKLPGLKKLIVAMLNSIPKLANVLVLLVFVLYIFSIIGITFFMGHQVRQLPRRDQSAHPESHPSPVFLPKRALT